MFSILIVVFFTDEVESTTEQPNDADDTNTTSDTVPVTKMTQEESAVDLPADEEMLDETVSLALPCLRGGQALTPAQR